MLLLTYRTESLKVYTVPEPHEPNRVRFGVIWVRLDGFELAG
jgi:hypothetical protein